MDATINIQAIPTPIMYESGGSVVVLPAGITDESNNVLQDESGNAIQPDP